MELSEYYIGFCTVPNMETGKIIAYKLIEQKLVACVNIMPQLTSIYRWQGMIHEDLELLLILKTIAKNISIIPQKIKDLHPYEVPEVIFFPIQAGFLLIWTGFVNPRYNKQMKSDNYEQN